MESQSRVLTDALSQANITATEVANLAKKYCQQSGKKVKGGCEDTVEVDLPLNKDQPILDLGQI